MYKDIPLGKGEDDGSIFSSFLKESRLPADMRSVGWEDVRDILDVYKVAFYFLFFNRINIYQSCWYNCSSSRFMLRWVV